MFAARPIRPGERVLSFGGSRVRLEAISDFSHFLEVGQGWFLGPSGRLDDLVNHSCRPNTAVESSARGVRLRAIRLIRFDEEICFDYSTVMVEDPTTFVCSCGDRHCRRIIGNWRTLAPRKRRELIRRGMVPEFTILSARRLEPPPGRTDPDRARR